MSELVFWIVFALVWAMVPGVFVMKAYFDHRWQKKFGEKKWGSR